MQKRLGILGIFLIVLMFVFSSGFVFADDVGLKILDSKLIYLDNNKYTINTQLSTSSKHIETIDCAYFIQNPIAFNKSDVDLFFSKLLYDSKNNVYYPLASVSAYVNESPKTSSLSNYFDIFTRNINKDKELYNPYLVTYFNNYDLMNSTFFYKIYTNSLNNSFNFDSNKDFNNVVLYTYCVSYDGDSRADYMGNINSSLSLKKLIEEEGDNKFIRGSWFSTGRSSYYRTEKYIFEEPNYETSSFEFRYDPNTKNNSAVSENSTENISFPIKLKSEIKDSQVSLSLEVGSGTIYYTLDGFDLNNYFDVAFKSIKETSSSLNTSKKVENIIPQIKKYTSPLSLSSGQKLNAIAVNYDNFTLSNYLEGITLSSSPSNSQSSSLNNFSINFKEDKKTNDVICEKETKICYAKINQNINLDLIANKVNDGNVYFAINNLTKDFTEINFNNPTSTLLSSNEIKLGNKLRFYNSNNKEFKMNLSQNNEGSFVLAAGQTYTNVDYLFFIFLHDENFEDLVKYKTLQKIINSVYCDSCKIPDWMPYNILTPAYQDPVCEEIIKEDGKVEKESCKPREDPKLEFSCDVYTSSLRNNLNIFNLGQQTNGRIYGDILTSQMNNITINPNNQSKFNNVVLDVSKGYKFTDEETVQFISILAQESTFGTEVEGGLNEFGFAQIHYDAWFGDSTKISNGKNQLKSYFEIILDNKDNLSDENIKNITTTDALYDYVNQTIVGYRNYKSPDNLNKMNYATTVFGGAIYLYNRDQILNNGNNFPRASFSTYDDKDSIDALFASASKYVTPKTGFNIKATMIAGGLITHDNALKTIYKMAYYLSYKKYICENKTNFFNITLNKSVPNTTSTSTNVNLSGAIPQRKGISELDIKNKFIGKTEYENLCAKFVREAGEGIFNYSSQIQRSDAWYFGINNETIVNVESQAQINYNNLVPGSILGIKRGNTSSYNLSDGTTLTNLPYTHTILYIGDFDGKENVVFDGGWNNQVSFYNTIDQYFNDHPTYVLKAVILPKGSVTDEQKAYLSECIKSKNTSCEYYT